MEFKRNPNFRLRKGISLSDEIDICKKYLSGESSVKIGAEYGVCHKTIPAILQAYGIDRTGNGVRKYNVDENYFDIIDTQNKAYILGMLYADGYNCEQKGSIRLSLQCEDKDILEKIRNEMKSEKPLSFKKCNDHIASNGFCSKDMYTLDIYSAYMSRSLVRCGMKQNKSLTLEYPKCIPEELHSHFIRGYFDGDGSLHFYTNKRGYVQPTLTITSTQCFCDTALSILRDSLGVGGGIYDASCHNGITKVLTFCGINQCKSILDWIYLDANLYMSRKYNKYQNWLLAS